MARIVPAVRGMYIALTLHLLWTLGAAAVITRRQRIPASAAAWLALVFLLPVAGTLLYVLAGYRRAVPAAEPCDCRGDAVEQIVARGCGTRPAPRNSVSLLHNGSNAFTALIVALEHAVSSIHMEYYIIRDDRIILRTAGQVTETATSANPMLQQVALMIRASMTGDLSQFGEGWQIGYDETEGAGTVRMVPLSRRARKYIDSIALRFDLENMTLDRMELNETEGGHSVYEFRDKRFNLAVDPAKFNP